MLHPHHQLLTKNLIVNFLVLFQFWLLLRKKILSSISLSLAGSIASHNGVLFHGQYHPICRLGFLWKWENGYSPFSDTAKYHVSFFKVISIIPPLYLFVLIDAQNTSKAQRVSSHSAVSSHIGLSGRWVEKVRRRNSGWYLVGEGSRDLGYLGT